MKFPVLWSGLAIGCCSVKCSEILAHIELPKNPRVNKVSYPILSYPMDFASVGMNAASVGYEFRMLLKRVTPESLFEIFETFYVDEISMF